MCVAVRFGSGGQQCARTDEYEQRAREDVSSCRAILMRREKNDSNCKRPAPGEKVVEIRKKEVEAEAEEGGHATSLRLRASAMRQRSCAVDCSLPGSGGEKKVGVAARVPKVRYLSRGERRRIVK